MKVLIYIRKVLFLFLCGALSFSYGYGQELPQEKDKAPHRNKNRTFRIIAVLYPVL